MFILNHIEKHSFKKHTENASLRTSKNLLKDKRELVLETIKNLYGKYKKLF